MIGRDRHIRTKPAELALLREHGLRVFWIAGKKDMATWGYLTRVVRRWDGIEAAVSSKGPGPWFVAITEQGLSTIPV